jgi:GNAT superfamily N-acetyltransferase
MPAGGSDKSSGPKGIARVRPPERLSSDHDLSAFQNGVHSSLDDWLRNRAPVSEGLSARTYVICDVAKPNKVVGYYAISTALEQRAALPSAKLRRGMPEQVPLLLIGRLAVDREFRGIGLGSELLSDAASPRRILSARGALSPMRSMTTQFASISTMDSCFRRWANA